MKTLIILALVSLALCQNFFFGDILSISSDRIHGFSFQYHRRHNVMLIRNSTACFVVDVDQTIEDDLKHKDTKEKLEDALYMQIKENRGEQVSSMDHLRTDLQDNMALFECFNHNVYTLTYMSP